MITARMLALLVALVCFLIASKPPAAPAVRWEWLGAALLVLSLLL